jgi:hypothetical protein
MKKKLLAGLACGMIIVGMTEVVSATPLFSTSSVVSVADRSATFDTLTSNMSPAT